MLAFRLPSAPGVKTTEIVQLPSLGTVALMQDPEAAKSPLAEPVSCGAPGWSESVPRLVTVTVSGALGTPFG